MITNYNCSLQDGRVHAYLQVDPDSPLKRRVMLGIRLDPPGKPLVDAQSYDEPYINVKVPEFGRTQARAADSWLVRYVAKVNAALPPKWEPAPVPVRPDARYES